MAAIISLILGCSVNKDTPTTQADSMDIAVIALKTTIFIEEAGIFFDLDSIWQRIEPEWIWARNDSSPGTIGVSWLDIEPPMEPEPALLPGNSRILESETIDLEWGFARDFTMEIFGEVEPGNDAEAPVIALEYHVLVQVAWNEKRRAYDFYSSHPDREGLEDLILVVHEVLFSVELLAPEAETIEKETR
jgi:hypothetical protein